MEDLFGESEPKPKAAKSGKKKPAPPPARFELYVQVAVNQPVEKPYLYGVPDKLVGNISPGSLVSVPFAGRDARGCVVSVQTDAQGIRVKPVKSLVSPEYRLEPELLDLAKFISDYYMAPIGETLSTLSFIGFNDVASAVDVRLLPTESEIPAKLTANQIAVVEFFSSGDGTAQSAAFIREQTGVSQAVLNRMLKKGILTRVFDEKQRGDDYESATDRDQPLELNEEQASAFAAITEALDSRRAAPFLLHGVTGSGKTEVYLHSIQHALQAGGSAIVLVPEISLTPQTMDRFRRRFGETVGIYHSRMTIGQKFDLWKKIRSGGCRIMVGARSALFSPMLDLRIIIIDEEHETSYKQDNSPRYNARDVSLVRARAHNAVVVLGSATPSIESYFKASSGRFRMLKLTKRIDDVPMPEVRIIDMMKEAKEGQNTDFFSEPLKVAMSAALERGEQVLLFLNRRGFFNFLVCNECSKVVRCRHCDITLTHHKPRNELICHTCGREYILFKKCPDCESTELSLIGMGTQRVEEHVREMYGDARIVRMDLDTTRKRTAFIEAWRRIESGNADVILGTQMIAKGFHLENVTLVGVPLADVSLFQPDFYAAERAFSVLTQVAGRAGRARKPGLVLIQSYVPHHYALQFAQKHDYVGFYEKEIRIRQVLRFPPHYRLISVLVQGADDSFTLETIKEFARELRNAAYKQQDRVVVLGPVPAPIAKINDLYRYRLVLRGLDRKEMRSVLEYAINQHAQRSGKSKVQLIIDVDPQDLM